MGGNIGPTKIDISNATNQTLAILAIKVNDISAADRMIVNHPTLSGISDTYRSKLS
jgi:hypothetical protein